MKLDTVGSLWFLAVEKEITLRTLTTTLELTAAEAQKLYVHSTNYILPYIQTRAKRVQLYCLILSINLKAEMKLCQCTQHWSKRSLIPLALSGPTHEKYLRYSTENLNLNWQKFLSSSFQLWHTVQLEHCMALIPLVYSSAISYSSWILSYQKK